MTERSPSSSSGPLETSPAWARTSRTRPPIGAFTSVCDRPVRARSIWRSSRSMSGPLSPSSSSSSFRCSGTICLGDLEALDLQLPAEVLGLRLVVPKHDVEAVPGRQVLVVGELLVEGLDLAPPLLRAEDPLGGLELRLLKPVELLTLKRELLFLHGPLVFPPLLLGLGQGELGQGLVVPLEDRQHLAGCHEVSLRRQDPLDPGAGPGADDDEPRRRLEPRQGMNRTGGSRLAGSGLPGTRTAALAWRTGCAGCRSPRPGRARGEARARPGEPAARSLSRTSPHLPVDP